MRTSSHSYLYDHLNEDEKMKFKNILADLHVSFNDLLLWRNDSYIFNKIDGEKLPNITISRKIHEISQIIYKTPEMISPKNLSLNFLGSSIEKYFPDGIKQGEATEISGTTGSGKTFFLFLLLYYNASHLFITETKAKIVYFDINNEFCNDFVGDYFTSNSHIKQIEFNYSDTLTKLNSHIQEVLKIHKTSNIKYLFIDNLDHFFIGNDIDRLITELEENFYRLTKSGIGVVYTCKLKKLYENKVIQFTDIETEVKDKLTLIQYDSTIKPKYFKQTKRKSIILYTHSGLLKKRRVLVMFEKGIIQRDKYLLRLDNFDYVSYKEINPSAKINFK